MNQWNVNRPTGGLFGKTPTRKRHGAESSWQDDPRRRRLFLTRWALGIGIAVNAVFAPLDSFMTAHVDQGVAEAICAVAFSIMAVYLRRSGRVEEMLLGAVAMAGAEMLYMLWSGWPDDEVVLWLPVFPAIAFPFLGQRKGVVAGGLFYAGAIGLMLWKPIHMTGEATSNLAGACATAALLIYSSEKTRAHIDQQLQKYADTDYLTGLHNRRSFEQQFGREVARALRHVEPLSLLLLDIDHFKVINDTHGHPAGDEAIRHIADTLRLTVRAEDLLGRIGGEEFAVLLPGTSLAEATVVAEKLRGAVAQSACSCGAERLPMTISIGVAAMTAKIQTVDALMREADRQLYLSKRRGRNCVSATDC